MTISLVQFRNKIIDPVWPTAYVYVIDNNIEDTFEGLGWAEGPAL